MRWNLGWHRTVWREVIKVESRTMYPKWSCLCEWQECALRSVQGWGGFFFHCETELKKMLLRLILGSEIESGSKEEKHFISFQRVWILPSECKMFCVKVWLLDRCWLSVRQVALARFPCSHIQLSCLLLSVWHLNSRAGYIISLSRLPLFCSSIPVVTSSVDLCLVLSLSCQARSSFPVSDWTLGSTRMVKKGRHCCRLRHLPPSFLAGQIISIL